MSTHQKIEALIFDLHGTLLDAAAGPQAFVGLVTRLPREHWPRARMRALTQAFPDIAAFARTFPELQGVDLAPYEAQVVRDIESVRAYPDSGDALTLAAEAGLKLGLLSNTASVYKAGFYMQTWSAWFHAACFSCDLGIAKPAPEAFAKICHALDVRPEGAVMIGDSWENDVRPARACGLQGRLVRRGSIITERASSEPVDSDVLSVVRGLLPTGGHNAGTLLA